MTKVQVLNFDVDKMAKNQIAVFYNPKARSDGFLYKLSPSLYSKQPKKYLKQWVG